ncbi:polysaccharide export protein (plasmid) [Thalassovita gelatinovora]|nr:polysaccharide export protein [Thalassovita gelatinovora]
MVLSMLVLSSCSLPRGAALSSEILKEQDSEDPGFQVVQVARGNVQGLQTWPTTGWSGSYNWLSNPRGPQSQIIRNGDQLQLVVWDSQENSLLAPAATKQANLPPMLVSSKGTIFMPYLGEVEIHNLTPDAARQKIQDALEPIAPSAQVQLHLNPGQQNSAALVGGVAQPGSYPLPSRNYTILSLLAQGGGIDPTLRNPVVRLIRDGRSYEIRADDLTADPGLDTTLRGGDKVVIVPDKRFFTALGATGREMLVYFDRETFTAMEALSTIGGLSDSRADLKSVLVLRDYPAKALRKDDSGPQQQQVVFVFDLTSADGLFAARKFQINPNDTVFATEALVTSARTVLGLIGSVVGISNSASNL